MSDLAIISDAAKLGTYITNTLKAYQTAGRRIHIAAISAVYHAAKTGDPIFVAKLFAGLRQNDQSAVRLFLRRSAAIVGLEGENPEGLPSEVVQAAIQRGKVLDFKNGDVIVVNGHTTDQAKALVTLCEKRFINPDGKNDHFLLDRDNFSEVRTLGDEDAIKRVLAAAKAIDTNSERVNVQVSDKVKKFLNGIRDQAETFQTQLGLSNG